MAVSTSSSTTTASVAVDHANLDRIENFFNTSSYRESLEVSATFNSRLSLERRHRLPFLDPQTGVAQRHCALYVKAKQRMPGLRSGQLYSFPAARWRKTKRQYLTNMMTDFECAISHQQHQQNQLQMGLSVSSLFNVSGPPPSFLGSSGVTMGGATSGGFLISQQDENSNSNASFLLDKSLPGESVFDGSVDTNSRDTNNNSKDELSKDWLYDDLEHEFDSEPKSPDDEYDYDPRYGNKKKKRALKKEPKTKKSSSAFGFDFNDSRSSGTTPKVRRTKESAGTAGTQKKGACDGTERRTRRKGAGAKSKKFVDPPSFESAAAGFDDHPSFGGSSSGWM